MTDQDLPLGEISEIVEEKASDEKLQKVRDKYGVDIVKYGRELAV